MQDELGDRIKGYEECFSYKYPLRLPLILRFDGKSFHTKVKKWKCQKPFDEKLIFAMANTAKYLCESISGSKIAYTQSDEITILVRNDDTRNTEAYFRNKMNKILSIGGSSATKAFIHHFFKDGMPSSIESLPEFDCRGFIVPEQEIINTFLWRQQDASKNSIQMLARSLFSHKQTEYLNGSQLQDKMMLEHGINWNDLPTYKKRGLCVVKQKFLRDKNDKNFNLLIDDNLTETYKNIIDNIDTQDRYYIRNAWNFDLVIPIFSKNTEYINRFANISSKESNEP